MGSHPIVPNFVYLELAANRMAPGMAPAVPPSEAATAGGISFILGSFNKV